MKPRRWRREASQKTGNAVELAESFLWQALQAHSSAATTR